MSYIWSFFKPEVTHNNKTHIHDKALHHFHRVTAYVFMQKH